MAMAEIGPVRLKETEYYKQRLADLVDWLNSFQKIARYNLLSSLGYELLMTILRLKPACDIDLEFVDRSIMKILDQALKTEPLFADFEMTTNRDGIPILYNWEEVGGRLIGEEERPYFCGRWAPYSREEVRAIVNQMTVRTDFPCEVDDVIRAGIILGFPTEASKEFARVNALSEEERFRAMRKWHDRKPLGYRFLADCSWPATRQFCTQMNDMVAEIGILEVFKGLKDELKSYKRDLEKANSQRILESSRVREKQILEELIGPNFDIERAVHQRKLVEAANHWYRQPEKRLPHDAVYKQRYERLSQLTLVTGLEKIADLDFDDAWRRRNISYPLRYGHLLVGELYVPTLADVYAVLGLFATESSFGFPRFANLSDGHLYHIHEDVDVPGLDKILLIYDRLGRVVRVENLHRFEIKLDVILNWTRLYSFSGPGVVTGAIELVNSYRWGWRVFNASWLRNDQRLSYHGQQSGVLAENHLDRMLTVDQAKGNGVPIPDFKI